jgi:phosphoribosylformylglycinamidine cyclo-ligase
MPTITSATDARDREIADLLSATMRRTFGPRVMESPGVGERLFRLDYQERLFARNFREPVLVSAVSGAGSKLVIGLQVGELANVGVDLVAQAANDLLTCGAEPLFFQYRLGTHELNIERVRDLLAGIADGCSQAGCCLIGGQTTEQPELYCQGGCDVAGFAVGVAERRRLVSQRYVSQQDMLIGLPSDGVHAHGVEDARRVLLEESGGALDEHVPSLGRTIGQELSRPTRIYVRPVVRLLRKYKYKRPIRAIAHVGVGGLIAAIRALMPDGCGVILRSGSWPIPPVFELLQSKGISSDQMPRLFNVGLGLLLVVRRAFADSAMSFLQRQGEKPVLLGRVRRADLPVEFRGL